MNGRALSVLWIVGPFTLSACLAPRGDLPPIETPGAIYRPNAAQELPLPPRRWDYDADHLLLFREGTNERGMFTPPVLALYDWRANDVLVLDVPDLNGLSDVAQGPGSMTVAYTTFPDDKVIVYDVGRQTTRTVAVGEHPAFSPDGNQLAIWRADKLVIVELETMTEKAVFGLPDPPWDPRLISQCCMEWSPDGSRLAYKRTMATKLGDLNETEQIVVFDLNTSNETISASGRFVDSPSWSPDGRLLTFVEGVAKGTALLVVDPLRQCTVSRLQIDHLRSAYWSPDGDVIAIVYWVSHLYFVDVKRVFGAPYTELRCP